MTERPAVGSENGSEDGVERPSDSAAAAETLPDAERFIDGILRDSHIAAAHELPGMISRYGQMLGVGDAVAYLADLQQDVLVPFLPPSGPDPTRHVEALSIDSTLAGRSFQQVEVLTQSAVEGGSRIWLPLLNGTDRLGVLGVTAAGSADASEVDESSVLGIRLRRFAALLAELIATKTMYGDTIVRLRRRASMGLAAEMQWSLLPPLTFACEQVTVAGALEPAYEVAGDSVDYAVDADCARFAVFDGMGHGLQSAQLASVSIAAYRNSRRAERSLLDSADAIEKAVTMAFPGVAFTTGVIAELDTTTGQLTWINAGHPEPLLLRDGRLVKPLKTRPVLPFGLTVASQPRPAAQAGMEQLEPGDRVLLYTDGVVEARSPDGEHYGLQRLTDLVTRNLAGGLPAPETMRRIVHSLLAHQQGQLRDDATLLMIEWRSGGQRSLLP